MKRLTNDQLEAIRKRAEAATGNILEDSEVMTARDKLALEDIPKLLAEIERLKEENRVIIESVFGGAMQRSAENIVKSIREKVAEARKRNDKTE